MNLILIILSVFLFNISTAQVLHYLDINNIITTVSPEGELFKEFRQKTHPEYNFFKTSSIWMGGYDPAGGLRLSTPLNFENKGYHFGPFLDNSETKAYNEKYNRVWKIDKELVEYHKKNYGRLGYVVPKELLDFPVSYYDSVTKKSIRLFNFIDINFNKVYEPELGDYPEVYGDQSIYFICKDKNKLDSIDDFESLYIQIAGVLFAFKSDKEIINNTIFLAVTYKSFSFNETRDFNMGLYYDGDIGDGKNDYVGSDEQTRTSYIYSNIAIDPIYQQSTPVLFCRTMANSLYTKSKKYSDRFIAFSENLNGQDTSREKPVADQEFYNYLSSRWLDGTPLTYGGTGYNLGSTNTTNFLLNGNPNDSSESSWNEISSKNIPGERKSIHSSGNVEIVPDESNCAIYAISILRDKFGNNLKAIDKYLSETKLLDSLFRFPFDIPTYRCSLFKEPNSVVDLKKNLFSITPNPAFLNIKVTFNDIITSSEVRLKLVDLAGKELILQQLQNENNETIVDLSNLQSGAYIMHIIYKGMQWQEKLIIN